MDEPQSKRRNRTILLIYVLVIVGVFIGRVLAGYVARGATLELEVVGREGRHRSAGTRRMATLLQRFTAETDPARNPFMNAARVKIVEENVSRSNGQAPPRLLMELAVQLLNSGRTDDAIALYDQLEGAMKAQHLDPRSRPWIELHLRQAIALLRRAEDDNCVRHHNPRSCLFPVRDAGVHGEKRGSRAAAAILESVLAANPDQRQARWLLPPELFESDYDIGQFPDLAATVGLDVDDLAGSSIVDDFDGDQDIYHVVGGRRYGFSVRPLPSSISQPPVGVAG